MKRKCPKLTDTLVRTAIKITSAPIRSRKGLACELETV